MNALPARQFAGFTPLIPASVAIAQLRAIGVSKFQKYEEQGMRKRLVVWMTVAGIGVVGVVQRQPRTRSFHFEYKGRNRWEAGAENGV